MNPVSSCFSLAYLSVYFAAAHAAKGGKVRLQKYLSMPHVFMIFEKHPSTATCYQEMAKFVKAATSGQNIETKMEIINGKGMLEKHLNFEPPTLSKSQVRFASVC
jgi:hypothetical protein